MRLAAALGLLLALAVTGVVYLPSLEAGFYFDDRANIVNAPALQWERFPSGNWRAALDAPIHPERVVPSVTFGLNHLWGGLDPRGYHVVNLAIHLFMGLVVAWLGYLVATEGKVVLRGGVERSVAPRDSAALGGALGAAAFLLHPLSIQAITYVVQRMASLAALFGVLSICFYITARRSSGGRAWWSYALSAMALLLAVGSKQNALMVPVVMMVYEACFHGGTWRERIGELLVDRRRRWWVAGAVAAVIVAVLLVHRFYLDGFRPHWFEPYPDRDFSGWERVLTQSRVHWLYVSLLLWPAPSRLNLDHDFSVSRSLAEPATLLAIVAWLVVAAGVVWLVRRRPRYGFPLLAYMVLHGVESGPVSLELVFEHRMYLPMAFLAALPAVLLADERRQIRRALVAAVTILLVPLAVATYQRNLVWSDAIVFSADSVEKSPGKPRPHNNYATILYEAGRYEEARREFEEALRLQPEYLEARVGLGKTLLELGEDEAADRQFGLAESSFPGVTSPRIERGNLLARQGRLPEAIEAFQGVVVSDPGNWGAHYNLGVTLLRAGRSREAIWALRTAQHLRSTWSETYRPLGDAYRRLGMREEALEQYLEALDREGESAALLFQIGTLNGELGRWDEALTYLSRSVAADDGNSMAHNNLGNVYLEMGDVERARRHYETSVRLDPGNTQARQNLESIGHSPDLRANPEDGTHQ